MQTFKPGDRIELIDHPREWQGMTGTITKEYEEQQGYWFILDSPRHGRAEWWCSKRKLKLLFREEWLED